MGEDDDVRQSAARYRVDRLVEQEARERAERGEVDAVEPDGSPAEEPRRLSQMDGRGRMDRRGEWVDELVRQAMARGEFDDLPLAGKPIPGIDGRHDPDWWLKGLVEREQITGVLPEALQLRTDDAALDARLDRVRGADQVRAVVEEFNARVVAARRQLLGGPPVVTPLRDVDEEVRRWSERARRRRDDDAARRVAERERGAQEQAERSRRRRARVRSWWPSVRRGDATPPDAGAPRG